MRERAKLPLLGVAKAERGVPLPEIPPLEVFGRRTLTGLLLGLICLNLFLGTTELSARAKKPKTPEQFSILSFVVLRETDGKPVRNASVVIHFLRKDGSQDDEGFQLKTDSNGRTAMDDIPYGKLRLQVVAHGLQTYGEDVEINSAKQEFVSRLNPPAGQVSIYK